MARNLDLWSVLVLRKYYRRAESGKSGRSVREGH